MDEKRVYTICIVLILAGLQVVAWLLGFNGQVFIFISMAIAAALGFSTGVNIKAGQDVREFTKGVQDMIDYLAKKQG